MFSKIAATFDNPTVRHKGGPFSPHPPSNMCCSSLWYKPFIFSGMKCRSGWLETAFLLPLSLALQPIESLRNLTNPSKINFYPHLVPLHPILHSKQPFSFSGKLHLKIAKAAPSSFFLSLPSLLPAFRRTWNYLRN